MSSSDEALQACKTQYNVLQTQYNRAKTDLAVAERRPASSNENQLKQQFQTCRVDLDQAKRDAQQASDCCRMQLGQVPPRAPPSKGCCLL